jgi:lysophospholipase L1-like esterase
MLPLSAQASENSLTIVALGDSITAGNGTDASYAQLVSDYYGATLVNYGQQDATSTSLLEQLDDASLQQTVASADIILVTIGSNDIMQAVLSNQYVDASQYSTMSALIAAMKEQANADAWFTYRFSLYLDQVMPDVIATCRSNLEQIASQLRAQNGSADIVFQTLYNPMDLTGDTAYTSLASSGSMTVLSSNVLKYLEGKEGNTIYPDGVNDTIRELPDVTVVDSYTLLSEHAYSYTNISSLDANPNAIGQLALAAETLEQLQRSETETDDGMVLRTVYASSGAVGILPDVDAELNDRVMRYCVTNGYGDVDANGTVEIADASAALELYACAGAGTTSSIVGVDALAADANGDGSVDLMDAAMILRYYAESAAGLYSGTFTAYRRS